MKPDQILASLSQLDHQKRPVTLVAIVFFSLACLSLGGMQAWSVYQARTVQLAGAAVASANLTRALAGHVANAIDLSDLMLTDVAERVPHQKTAQEELEFGRYLSQRMQRMPLLAELSVYDQHGVRTATSGASPAAPFALARQLAFHQGATRAALMIGAPVKSGVDGAWLLPLSRGLSNGDGAFAGVVLATIRLAHLRRSIADFELGAHGTILVALDSGPLLFSHRESEPDHANNAGRDMRRDTAFAAWRGNKASGSVLLPASAAGGATLTTYRHLGAYPVLVAVSRSADQILTDWWDSAYLSTAGVLLLLLIQLWLGVRLYDQIALRDRLEKDRRSLQKLLVKKSRSLRRQALMDALTGIANRRELDMRLVREFARATDEGTTLALVILDVDYFKKYNDQYGHPAGDECLKFVAACVNGGRRRSDDLAARMGGEEFALLLPNTGLRGAIAVAEAIRKQVAAHRLTHVPTCPHRVTVSCGVHALAPVAGMAPSVLVEAADRALYLAKTSGRNRVRADGPMPLSGLKRFSLVVNK